MVSAVAFITDQQTIKSRRSRRELSPPKQRKVLTRRDKILNMDGGGEDSVAYILLYR
jgi:hypothetical protein